MTKMFKVTFGRTVNLGDYNSLRIELSQEFYVDEVSSYDVAFRQIQQAVDERISRITNQDPPKDSEAT